MERRVLLAILLSFVVLYAYQALVVKPKPADATASGAAATSPAAPSNPAQTAQPPAVGTAPAGASAAGQAPARTAAPVLSEQTEHDIQVETPNVVAVFTNRGARLKSWRLKH